MSVKVRFGDLDPYNHVNHARYLTYFESARIELLEEIGFGMGVLEGMGVQIVLVEIHAGFHAAAELHDTVTITTEVLEVKRATARWRQRAHRGEELIASLDVWAAFTDLSGRPSRPPEGFTDALSP